MDDGAAEYAGVSLQTHSFSLKDVDTLRKIIKERLGIETGRHLNKGRWVIYFSKASLPQLKKLVGKYMLPEFRYKLIPYSKRVNPVETIRRVPLDMKLSNGV